MNQIQAKSLENAWKGIHFLKHFSHLVCNFTEETELFRGTFHV